MKTKMKINIMYNVGSSKYLVNYSDGTQTHKDGSEFFNVKLFKSKKKMSQFITDLQKNNYNN